MCGAIKARYYKAVRAMCAPYEREPSAVEWFFSPLSLTLHTLIGGFETAVNYFLRRRAGDYTPEEWAKKREIERNISILCEGVGMTDCVDCTVNGCQCEARAYMKAAVRRVKSIFSDAEVYRDQLKDLERSRAKRIASAAATASIAAASAVKRD